MEATEKEALTNRQRQLYEFIHEYIVSHSFSPTLSEMAIHLKVTTAGVLSHLVALERKGWIEWTRGFHRGVSIVAETGHQHVTLKVDQSACIGDVKVNCIGVDLQQKSVTLEFLAPDTMGQLCKDA